MNKNMKAHIYILCIYYTGHISFITPWPFNSKYFPRCISFVQLLPIVRVFVFCFYNVTFLLVRRTFGYKILYSFPSVYVFVAGNILYLSLSLSLLFRWPFSVFDTIGLCWVYRYFGCCALYTLFARSAPKISNPFG